MNWKPQPKQLVALARNEDEILYGGARGGGKTEAGLAWLSYDTQFPFYRALVIRRNAEDLKDWIDRAREFYRRIGGEVVGNPPEIRFPKGGLIRTGHLKDEAAYTRYQGHQYPKMLIEELSQIPREKDYLRLMSSCRSPNPEIKPQLFSTTNPDDPGLEWIKDRWKIPDLPDFSRVYEGETSGGRTTVFIPAKLEDNPLLMKADPNYIKYLEELKEKDRELYDSWRHGNWKGFGIEGAYYRQQMIRAEAEGRVTDVPYDETLDVHTWCDLGIGDCFAIGYFQVSGTQWRFIDYDEFEGESLVEAIGRMRAKGYRYGSHYAPHDIKVRDLGSGKSRLEIAALNGVNYQIVPRLSPEDGINAVRTRFTTLWIDKTKGDLFLKRVRRFHKEFDAKRGRYKNVAVHDINSHGADMLRYWATTDFKTYSSSKIINPNLKGYTRR